MPLQTFDEWKSSQGSSTSVAPSVPTPAGLSTFDEWKKKQPVSTTTTTPAKVDLMSNLNQNNLLNIKPELTPVKPLVLARTPTDIVPVSPTKVGGVSIQAVSPNAPVPEQSYQDFINILNPNELSQAAYDSAKGAIENVATKFYDLIMSLDNQPTLSYNYQEGTPEQKKAILKESTPLGKAINFGEFGMSLVMFYPPIAQFNAEMAAAKELPGPLSWPAKAIDYGFNKLSELGTWSLKTNLDAIPDNIISKENKDYLTPFLGEVSSFVTLVAGSHIGFKAMENGIGGIDPSLKLAITKEFKGTDGQDYVTTKEMGTILKKDYISFTEQSGLYSKLPVSEKTKENISKGVQVGVGLSMQPFSTAYGLASAKITAKIQERKNKGIEITPVESKKIIDETMRELPVDIEKVNQTEPLKIQTIEPTIIGDKNPIKPFGGIVSREEVKKYSPENRTNVISEEGITLSNIAEKHSFNSSDVQDFSTKISERIPNAEYIKNASVEELAKIRDNMQALRQEVKDKELPTFFEKTIGTKKQIDASKKLDTVALRKLGEQIEKSISIAEDHASTILWNKYKISEGDYPKGYDKTQERGLMPSAEQIKAQGGVTINLKGESPTEGYVYSPDKTTEFSLPVDKFTESTIDSYWDKHYNELIKDGNYFGVWEDGGKMYLDVSKNVINEHNAVVGAKASEQIGIYDIKNGKTKYTADYNLNAKGVYQHSGDGKGGNVQGENTQESKGGTSQEGDTQNEQLKSRVFERLQAENPESLKGDATYTAKNLKEESAKAVDLIATDKQKAFDIAMGSEKSSDVLSTSVNIALSEKALEEGNLTLYNTLVKNRSFEQTRRGQEIVAEKGSVSDNSITRYVKELLASRLSELGKNVTGDLKESVGKKSSTKEKGLSKIKSEVDKVSKKIEKTKELDLAEAQSIIDKLTCA